jgi:hypothetical protein
MRCDGDEEAGGPQVDECHWKAESKADWPEKTRGSRVDAHGGQASAGKTEEDRDKRERGEVSEVR